MRNEAIEQVAAQAITASIGPDRKWADCTTVDKPNAHAGGVTASSTSTPTIRWAYTPRRSPAIRSTVVVPVPDLREDLIESWARHDWAQTVGVKPWDQLDDGTQARLIRRIQSLKGKTIDEALLPIIRQHLAAAWDDGWHIGYRAEDYGDDRTGANPWREP